MNKKTLLKIAKTIYLQDIVSKQLYASLFNPNKFFNNDLGDFRAAQRLQSVYSVFIDQPQRTKTIQFLKKDKLDIEIYKFLWGDKYKCSKEMMGVMSLNQTAMYLTSLQSFIDSKAGGNGMRQDFNKFYKKYTNQFEDLKQTKNGSTVKDQKNAAITFANELINQFNAFYGMFEKFSKIIVFENNVDVLSFANKIKQSLQKFKNQIQLKQNFAIQDLYDMEQFREYYVIDKQIDYIRNKILQKSEQNDFIKNIVDSLTTNASRINMLNKMYYYAKDFMETGESEQDKFFASCVRQAIYTCNTIDQLNKFDEKKGIAISKQNLQNKFGIFEKGLTNKQRYEQQSGFRYRKKSFIQFISGTSNSGRIKRSVFDNGIINCLTTQVGGNQLSESQKEQLEKLSQVQQRIIENSKNKDKFDYVIKSTDDWLYYQDFVKQDPELMKQIKQTVEYF